MKFKILIIISFAIISILFSIAVGSVYISPIAIFQIIFYNLFGIFNIDYIHDSYVAIIWNVRLPRVILAFIVGSMLSVSGAIIQSVLRNPLASPFTLGISSGSSFGAALVFILGITAFEMFTLPFFGFIFGIITIIFVLFFSSKISNNMDNTTIILSGMVISLFINAIVTLLISVNRESLQRLIFWQMGSFSARGWDAIIILFPIAIIFISFAYFRNLSLDIISFGEETAKTMGVNIRFEKWILLGVASLLTGSSIAFVGIIGFIDLISSHIVRRIFGSAHSKLIIFSAIFGGSFMVFSDLISRIVIPPSEIPIGVITSLLGAPFFAYIYFKGRKNVKN